MVSTVEKTVEHDLCVSCGICKAVCPVGCIDMKFSQGQFLPMIDKTKCTECLKCRRVCPGFEVDFEMLYSYESRDLPEDILTGDVLESYIVHTKDKKIREEATSGGVITTLLVNLIEKGLYDKVFVVKFEKFKGEEVKAVPTSKVEDIIEAAKSKYLPVSMEEVITYIQNNPDEKIAVVGTSCHFHGIKKFLLEEYISSENILFLGLFCEKTLNFNLLQFYEDRYAKKDERIINFNYRNKQDNGWPGNSKIEFNSRREVFIDRKVRMRVKRYFQLNRCLYCIDKLNQFADISFGDCYIDGEESNLGKSNILIRTKKGKNIFGQINNLFEFKKVEIDKIFSSQNISKKNDNLIYDRINNGENINKLNLKLEQFEKKKLKKQLQHKKNTIKKGKYYENNKVLIKKEIKKNNFKLKLKILNKVLIKLLDIIGLKELVKKVVKY
ncbi:MAG: Coenzyme F420 hydrogenase/dehydrogenase, beta subunit C-terminal domain [archaeon]